jgi:signal transduction histidine kinase
MFGPAGQTYRARASEIVAQSHLLLAAIDDLDLAAKLQAGTYTSEVETDLAQVLEDVVPGLEEKARAVDVELRLLVEPHLPPCAVSPPVVERLLQRLIGALIDCSAPAERLRVTASQWNESCTLSVDRPLALKNVGEDDLLDPAFSAPRQRNSRLSLGFSLRLVRGIAQLAGGDLVVNRSNLTLVMTRGDLRPPASRRYRLSAGQGL